jgi:hypothetical protein
LDASDLLGKQSEVSMHIVLNFEPLPQQFGIWLDIASKASAHLLSNGEYLLQHSVFPHCQSPNKIEEDFLFHSTANYRLRNAEVQ